MSPPSQTEQNRRTVARYWDEVWTKGNVSAIDELCADDFKQFYPLHGAISGKENVKKMLASFREVGTPNKPPATLPTRPHPHPFSKFDM
jgi:predicted SnoaL-like aldol condensation-catalyzing enzyme